MHYLIKNLDALVSRSEICRECREARTAALKALKVGLETADPELAVEKSLRREGDHVIVDRIKVKPRRVVVVGFGKASYKMARATLRILGDLVTSAILSIPKGVKVTALGSAKIIKSGHPTPDRGSIEAAVETLKLLKSLDEGDLVIALISGGGSALLELPRPPITLEDLQKTTSLLLRCGASIHEINTVRKHISMVKGGQLAREAHPALVISLIISDVVGDPIEFIASGPTAPDTTTFKDAVDILKRYTIWDAVPQSVREVLTRGVKGEIPETPKPGDPIFENVINRIIASNRQSLHAMKRHLETLGYRAMVLTSRLQGEARVVGSVLASILREAREHGEPLEPPLALIAGGETTVTVRGSGRGGRNQEVAMAASKVIRGLHGVSLASIGSDGIDGVTDAAGAIVDGHTYERGKVLGLNYEHILEDNNSYEYFKRLKDHIFTGPTGTNVNDLIVGVVTSKR